jgi:hypothetical protein
VREARRRGGEVAGQDLQRDPAVLIQRELPAFPVGVEADPLVCDADVVAGGCQIFRVS